MAAYLKQGDFPAKTVSEAELALRIFETVVGNKAIGTLTRADFTRYLEHLSERQVGGKTEGSIRRFLSPASITKRLGFVRSAIQLSIDRNVWDGPNPASGIKIQAFVKKLI